MAKYKNGSKELNTQFEEKRIRFKRTKRFLFNSEDKYEPKEIFINWIVVLGFITSFVFITLFSIYSKDVKITNFKEALKVSIPQPASAFSLTGFIALVIAIASICIKLLMRRKRRKDEKWNQTKN